MSQDIASMMTELKTLVVEIKNRQVELAKFRKRKEVVEKSILNFLEEKEQPGVKYNGTTVVAQEKIKRTRKKKDEKIQDCINVLAHYNISNGDKIYNEIMEAIKGEEIQSKILKITDINK
jgi:citrate lyase alpha subunit